MVGQVVANSLRDGPWINLALCTLVVFVILLPLLVLGSQTRLAPYLSSLEYGIWLPLTLALLFASGVLAAAAQSLLRLRAAVQ